MEDARRTRRVLDHRHMGAGTSEIDRVTNMIMGLQSTNLNEAEQREASNRSHIERVMTAMLNSVD